MREVHFGIVCIGWNRFRLQLDHEVRLMEQIDQVIAAAGCGCLRSESD